MEDINVKEIEQTNDKKPVELSFLEREASDLASDPNMWYVKKYTTIIDLLNSIATSLNILVKYNEERRAKEQEMMSKMGGFVGGFGAGSVLKNMFGRKIEKDESETCKDGF